MPSKPESFFQRLAISVLSALVIALIIGAAKLWLDVELLKSKQKYVLGDFEVPNAAAKK